MVNIYDELWDTDGNIIAGRTKLFVPNTCVDEEGNITSAQSGILTTASTSGYMYIVDEWITETTEKLKIINGVLMVKDGEVLVEPEKTDLEMEEEALKKRIAEIQIKKQNEELQKNLETKEKD